MVKGDARAWTLWGYSAGPPAKWELYSADWAVSVTHRYSRVVESRVSNFQLAVIDFQGSTIHQESEVQQGSSQATD